MQETGYVFMFLVVKNNNKSNLHAFVTRIWGCRRQGIIFFCEKGGGGRAYIIKIF